MDMNRGPASGSVMVTGIEIEYRRRIRDVAVGPNHPLIPDRRELTALIAPGDAAGA